MNPEMKADTKRSKQGKWWPGSESNQRHADFQNGRKLIQKTCRNRFRHLDAMVAAVDHDESCRIRSGW